MQKPLAASPQDRRYTDAISDLLTLTRILQTFLEEIELEAWSRRGRHVPADEWTLHQTVAHLVSAAEFYRSAIQRTLHHDTIVIPGFQQRQDLPAYNQQEIQHRQHLHPSALIAALRQALVDTVELAQHLTPDQLSLQVSVPVFNRPLTVLELLETQITHPGMVHAAQIARPADRDPLWRGYDASFLHRMLTRFFHLMALIYWPERGGDLCATFQFLVAGTAGGGWYLTVSPTEARSEEGRAPRPQVTLWAASADALCLVFTRQLGIGQAIIRRKLFAWGNLLLATKLTRLFSPT